MAIADVQTSGFSFGRVFGNTFSVIGRNFGIFLAAAVIGALPLPLFQFLVPGSFVVVPAAGGAPHLAWAQLAGSVFLSIVCTYFVQAMLVYGTIVDLNGGKMSLVEALKIGARSVLPLIAIAVLSGLGAILGFILLIVPGLMLITAWIVVVPVYVTENVGLLGVFGRSAALTRGHRWSIFGLLLILGLATLAIGVLLGLAFGGFGTNPTMFSPSQIAAQTVERIVGLMLGAALVASIYYELRTAKEGAAPAQLAAVFD
jgi:hypothetical protein